MAVEVKGVSEKQSMEISLTVNGKAKTIVIRFDKDDVKTAEISADGQNWIGVMEAKAAIQAFVEKYAIDLE